MLSNLFNSDNGMYKLFEDKIQCEIDYENMERIQYEIDFDKERNIHKTTKIMPDLEVEPEEKSISIFQNLNINLDLLESKEKNENNNNSDSFMIFDSSFSSSFPYSPINIKEKEEDIIISFMLQNNKIKEYLSHCKKIKMSISTKNIPYFYQIMNVQNNFTDLNIKLLTLIDNHQVKYSEECRILDDDLIHILAPNIHKILDNYLEILFTSEMSKNIKFYISLLSISVDTFYQTLLQNDPELIKSILFDLLKGIIDMEENKERNKIVIKTLLAISKILDDDFNIKDCVNLLILHNSNNTFLFELLEGNFTFQIPNKNIDIDVFGNNKINIEVSNTIQYNPIIVNIISQINRICHIKTFDTIFNLSDQELSGEVSYKYKNINSSFKKLLFKKNDNTESKQISE